MKSPVLKIAVLTAYPASEILDRSLVKPKYVGREHPTAWVRALCRGFRELAGVDIRLFVDSRAVRRGTVVESDMGTVVFTAKREPIRSNPYHGFLPAWLRLRPHVSAFDPHIIHAFGAEEGCSVIASRFGCPCVVSIQGIYAKLAEHMRMGRIERIVRLQLERMALRRATGIVAETQFAETWGAETAPHVKSCVIPHAVNTEFLSAPQCASTPALLCVGSLVKHKGQQMVLEAFAQCRTPGAELILVGDGPDRDTLARQAVALGVSERVQFKGKLSLNALAPIMSGSRALVLGSRMDTAPNVITEAHAVGVPVIATSVGGIPEMVDHGVNGFLVPHGDVPAMAARMTELLGNATRAKEMGAAGRKHVSWLNAPLRVAEAHLGFYRSILT